MPWVPRSFLAVVAMVLLGGPAAPREPLAPAMQRPDPAEAEKYFERGRRALEAGQVRQAVSLLRQCVARNAAHCGCLRALSTTPRGDERAEHARLGFLQSYVDQCSDAGDSEQFYARLASEPPRAPRGLTRCRDVLRPTRPLPRTEGETIRYHVDINGISVGTIDFQIHKNGTFEGQPVTEYRSSFAVDSFVSTFAAVDGRAASIVPQGSNVPLHAMSRYQIRSFDIAEDLRFERGGTWVWSERRQDDKESNRHRRYPTAALDFLSGFYELRALEPGAQGCAIFFGGGRVHTIWLEPRGVEKVKTPAGMRDADKLYLRYGSEVSNEAREAFVWLGQDADRVPYRAVLNGDDTIEARVHLFEKGH